MSPRETPDWGAGGEDQRVRKMELLISTLLRSGVISSLIIVVLGIIISFIGHPAFFSSPAELQRLIQRDGSFPHTFPAIAGGIIRFNGEALIMFGLILLITTPVMRVAVSIFAFLYQRDQVFVVITTIVLALLILSFVLGMG